MKVIQYSGLVLLVAVIASGIFVACEEYEVPGPMIQSHEVTSGGLLIVQGDYFREVTDVFVGEYKLPGSKYLLDYDELPHTLSIFLFDIDIPPGTYDLLIESSWGSSSIPGIEVSGAHPEIEGLVPSKASRGDTIYIQGKHLNYIATVQLNDLSLTPFALDDDVLGFEVPAQADLGSNAVSVENSAGIVSGNQEELIVLKGPGISDFSPKSVQAGGQVEVIGEGLSKEPEVYIGGIQASILGNTDERLQLEVPIEATSGEITVFTSEGKVTSDSILTIITNPVITSIDPAQGGPGSVIYLRGSYFNPGLEVFIGLTKVTEVEYVSEGEIKIVIPEFASTGFITLQQVFNGEVLKEESNMQLMITGTPFVSGISPESVVAGALVTVYGANLKNMEEALVGSSPARIVGLYEDSLKLQTLSSTQSGRVELKDAEGEAYLSTGVLLINHAPEIQGFFPEAGSPGTRVTVKGNYFEGQLKVWYGSVEVPFEAMGFETLGFDVPTGAEDEHIRISNSYGEGISTNMFHIVEAPGAFSHTPASGKPGTVVRLTGDGISGVSDVYFNGVRSTITETDENLIVTYVPSEATTGYITIENEGGQAASQEAFIIEGVPAITEISPSRTQTGEIVTVTGVEFIGPLEVYIGDQQAELVSQTDTRIELRVPVEAVSGKVIIRFDNGSEISSASDLIIGELPTITTVEPITVVAGDKVTITGEHLNNISEVYIGSTDVGSFTVISPNELEFVVPQGATSNFLSLISGGETIVSTDKLIIQVAVDLSSIEPLAAYVGDQVLIRGSNLQDVQQVLFKENSSAEVIGSKSQEIIVKVPTGAVTGNLSLVTSSGVIESDDVFVVLEQELPKLVDFQPKKGVPGQKVELLGENLGEASTVRFGNTAASIIAKSDSKIEVLVPAISKDEQLVIDYSGGQIASSESFELIQQPEVFNFYPLVDSVGAVVTIAGKHLNAVQSVTLGALQCQVISSSSDELIVSIPAGASSSTFALTGTSIDPVTTDQSFTVLPYPSIQGISPASVNAGENITITGSNFDGLVKVTIGGVLADILANTTGSIDVRVPDGIISSQADVRVTARGGTSDPFSLTVTEISPAPFINETVPRVAYRDRGFLIRGTNLFGAKVFLAGQEISVNSNTDGVITFQMPSDANSGELYVQNQQENLSNVIQLNVEDNPGFDVNTGSAFFTPVITPSISGGNGFLFPVSNVWRDENDIAYQFTDLSFDCDTEVGEFELIPDDDPLVSGLFIPIIGTYNRSVNYVEFVKEGIKYAGQWSCIDAVECPLEVDNFGVPAYKYEMILYSEAGKTLVIQVIVDVDNLPCNP